jgi:ATP-dependent RNA helicase DeaD
MPRRIDSIAQRYQRNPVRIKIGLAESNPAARLVRQTVYVVQRNHKPAALGRILDIEAPQSALVFCRTRLEVDQLTETMNGRGYRALALHGGMDQAQRDRVMARLRDGSAELLVATDVAARGIDVDTLTHVVNYDVPSAPESYVHRIGRVGRAGREGVAITLAEPRQKRLLANIERITKQEFVVARVPSVADLRARQIESTVAAVREALADGDLDEYEVVLNGLAGDDNLRQIALAAIKLVHAASGATVDEPEIPDASHQLERERGKNDRHRGGDRDRGRSDRKQHASDEGATGFVYVAAGRKGGIRPADLVGAIANETHLVGRQIGPIRISDHFSVVGVPERDVDTVVNALTSTSLKGRKVSARRYGE